MIYFPMFYTKCYSLYVFVYGGPCKENFLTGWFFLHILSKWLVKKVTILFISIRAVTAQRFLAIFIYKIWTRLILLKFYTPWVWTCLIVIAINSWNAEKKKHKNTIKVQINLKDNMGQERLLDIVRRFAIMSRHNLYCLVSEKKKILQIIRSHA